MGADNARTRPAIFMLTGIGRDRGGLQGPAGDGSMDESSLDELRVGMNVSLAFWIIKE
jgi:hypothetical protein